MRKLAVDMVRAADLLPAGNMLTTIPPAVGAQVTRDMTGATAATDSCNSCNRLLQQLRETRSASD